MSKTTNNIETKLTKLRELVNWFESDDFVLEEATTRFEEASRLAKEIEEDLKTMKNHISVVKKSFEQAE